MGVRLKQFGRSKFVRIYYLVMLALSFYFAIQFKAGLSDGYSPAGFPQYLRFWIFLLFTPFVIAVLSGIQINNERNSGMLRQTVLHGNTREQYLNVNIALLSGFAISTIFFLHLTGFVAGLLTFGAGALDTEIILHTLLQDVLLVFPVTSMTVGFVLITLYTADIVMTTALSMFILLFDNLINQFFRDIVCKFWFPYYLYAYAEMNRHPIEGWMIPQGIILCIISGIVMYLLALRKIKKMEL